MLSHNVDIYIYYTGWWLGTFFLFVHVLGIIIPTEKYFSEGWTPVIPAYGVITILYQFFCTPVLHPEVILLAISPMNVSIVVPLNGTYPISYSDVETKHCKHRWFSQHHEIVAHCTRWCPIVS
jgi:hypothetical protein